MIGRTEPPAVVARERSPIRAPDEPRRAVAQAVGGCLAVLAIVAIAIGLTRPPERPPRPIDATSVFGRDRLGHGPARAFDGDRGTEWHAEDMTDDTALIWRWGERRRVVRVDWVNSTNPPWLDRATDRYRIELLDRDGAVIASAGGRAAWGSARRGHAFGGAPAYGLRFVARTHHASGAGVAEIEVEFADR